MEIATNTIRPPDTELLVRNQLRLLQMVSRTIGIDEERQRRALLMTTDKWAEWSAFLLGGPLPSRPKLPVLLQRLGATTHRLAVLADRLACGLPGFMYDLVELEPKP
jgi:hypothetical protein